MKKLITITSLLIAGTALANATDYDYSVLALPDVGTQATQKGSGVGIDTYDGISEAELIRLAKYDVAESGVSIYGGANTGYTSTGSIANWGTTGDCTISSGNITSGYTIDMYGRSGMSGEWFAAVFSVSNADLSAAKLTATLPTFNGNDFTLGIVGYSTASGSVVSYITQDFTASASEVSLVLEGLDSTVDRLAFIVDGPSGGATTRYQVTNLSFSTGVISVPEPSAFGLLAGAGALALVAARRRRQKKA
ncbi:MAG: PEP-CTERM sorting domain-containing protein [Candidatus Spyradosoma sp.]